MIFIAHRAFGKTNIKNLSTLVPMLMEHNVSGVEIDVQTNSRGIPIVVHDYLFDKKQEYPLLSDVLKVIGDRIRTEIEIKSYEADSILAILKTIKNSKIEKYEITSADPPVLSFLTNQSQNFEKGLMIRDFMFADWMPLAHKNRLILGYLKLTGANVLHLDLRNYNQDLILALNRLRIKSHTLLDKPTKSDVNNIYRLGIDICSVTRMEDLESILSYK